MRHCNCLDYKLERNFRKISKTICFSCMKFFSDKSAFNKELNARLATNLRSRLYIALKGKFRTNSAVRDLGCSIEKLKLWLEMHWQDGMTWDNYGFYGWHIDHIIPLSKFDLKNKEDCLKACHFSNLQPLWAEENLKKSNKI